MMIVLGILKWIGIVLLAILAFVLLILLLVLFVPFRYRISGRKDEDIGAEVRVSWLLHLVHVSLVYRDKKLPLTARAAGIPVFRKMLIGGEKKEADPGGEKPGKKKAKKAGDKPEKKKKKKAGEEPVTEVPDLQAEETQPVSTVPDTGGVPDKPKKAEKRKKPGKPAEAPEHPFGTMYRPEEKKPEPPKRITPIWEWFSEKLFLVTDKAEAVLDKKDGIVRKADKAISLVEDDHFGRAFALAMRALGAILKSLAPNRGKALAQVGMPDKPQTMGQILMAAGILYPFTEKHITLEPDFENEVLKADGWLSGRLFVCVVAWWGVRLLLSRDVRWCIKAVKTLK